MKGLTDIPGIRVGHASDYEGLTGCTVILCDGGAVAGCDIRGSATGTEELDVLSPGHLTDRIHAVALAGGSAFGLEAASGVRRFLEQQGIGFPTRAARVPLVPAAILYDLAIGKAGARPTREMGEAAAAAATSEPVVEGAVGAGTGATVGKLFGMAQAMKAGVGSYSLELEGPFSGVRVAALVAVNAFGDVRDPDSGRLIAGARRAPDSRELADTAKAMRRGTKPPPLAGQNTTLAVVATNARLTKVQATKLAQLAGTGMARALSPAWTTLDGDLVIALSLGNAQADLDALGVAAAEAVGQAIVRAARKAPTLGGVPGLGE
jgi:L-aminopeptidase/D-esterase-like protein